MLGLKEITDARTPTFYFKDQLEYTSINNEHIKFIKDIALKTGDSARICLHKDTESDLHNMLIVHPKGKYIRPHKNPKRSKAYQIIEGVMRVIGIDDARKKLFDVEIGEKGERVLRVEANVYLLLLPLTEFVVFHEIALGPFVRGGDSQVYASFSPEEERDREVLDAFVSRYTTWELRRSFFTSS